MSFVYTMQEIEPRNRRLLIVSVLAGLGVLLVWLIWFLAAPIYFYETSATAQIDPFGRIQATFDESAQTQFTLGQTAAFQTVVMGGQTRQFPVRLVALEGDEGLFYFAFVAPSPTDRALLTEGLQGSIRIAIYRQTPLQIVLQAIGTST